MRRVVLCLVVPLAACAPSGTNEPGTQALGTIEPGAGPAAWPADCGAVVARLAAGGPTEGAPVAVRAPDGIRLANDLGLPAGGRALCRIEVGPAVTLDANEPEVVRRTKARGSRPEGTERRRNPAYDAARRALQDARKSARDDEKTPRLLKPSDPALALLGLAIRGAIGVAASLYTTPEERRVKELEAALAATPKYVEAPRLKPYTYDVREVKASRRASVAVALADAGGVRRQTGIVVEEEALFALGEGRHPDDATSAGAAKPIDRAGLAAWLKGTPEVPVSRAVTALADPQAPLPAPIPLVALPPGEKALAGLFAVEPAAGPTMPSAPMPGSGPGSGPAPGPALTLVEAKGVAFYVAPDLLLTAAKLDGGSSLVAVDVPSQGRVWAMIEAEDAMSGLTLLYTPRSDMPLPLGPASPPPKADASLPPGTPLLVGGEVVGVAMGEGEVVGADRIAAFLARTKGAGVKGSPATP